MQNTLAEISLSAIADNALTFRKRTKKLCAVVKADAYGHGGAEVAFRLAPIADMFAVATTTEAQEISLYTGGKDVLVLTPPIGREDVEFCSERNFLLSVGNTNALCTALSVGKKERPVRVHVAVNTGMNRYGFSLEELKKALPLLKDERLSVEGVYSHLGKHERAFADLQRSRFVVAERELKRYFPHLLSHLSATYGTMLGEKFSFDMARVGLGLYGYYPEDAEKELLENAPPLKKAMKIFATVSDSREYEDGLFGYTEPSKEDILRAEKVGLSTIRVGYADGFFRRKDFCLSPLGDADLCMDAVVSVGKRNIGDRVEIFDDVLPLAKKAGTIGYERLCAATRRADKIYTDEFYYTDE